MTASDPVNAARDRALRFLEARDRSRREVETRLRRYGYEPEVVASVLEWLDGLGYLDDSRFASAYARDKARAGWGRRRIQAGLVTAGVPHGVIADTFDALGTDPLWSEGAAGEDALAALVRRRFSRDRQKDPSGTERRAAAFLQRRGHDWETVRRVLRAAFDEPEEQGFR